MIDSYDPDGSLEQAHRAHQTAFAAAGDDHKAEAHQREIDLAAVQGVGLKAAEVENERLRALVMAGERDLDRLSNTREKEAKDHADKLDRLRAQIVAMNQTEGTLPREIERLRAYALQIEQENGEMRREIERLRAALQKVEWAQAVKDGDDVLYSCPGCGNPKDAGRHHPECPIGVALANSKPD